MLLHTARGEGWVGGGGGVCGKEGHYLKKEVGAPQAAVEAHPAGAAVVQALLQVLQGGPAGPLLHL